MSSMTLDAPTCSGQHLGCHWRWKAWAGWSKGLACSSSKSTWMAAPLPRAYPRQCTHPLQGCQELLVWPKNKDGKGSSRLGSVDKRDERASLRHRHTLACWHVVPPAKVLTARVQTLL